MASFHLKEIARILGQEKLCDTEITGFEQDSRLIVSGNLFFALKGEKADGHMFLEDVAKQGGRCAIVSKEYTGDDYGLFLIKVDDVLSAMHTLAKRIHACRKTRVIAVTGSVGKTTTKEFIATLLEGQFKVTKTPGNANSQVGVALSILNTEGDEEVFVIEMGMSQRGEIEKLVHMAPPEIAVLTNISYSHVVFFPEGINGIAQAKSEIFSSPETRLGLISEQAAQFPVVWESVSCAKRVYSTADYVIEKGKMKVIEPENATALLPFAFEASHFRENFLAAVLVARAMGMSWHDIAEQTSRLTTISKRFEKIVRNGIVFINDSYNANATSTKAALQNLPLPSQGKKTIAVLGAMKELGEYTQQMHKEVAECALQHVDQLLCLGKECQIMVDLFQGRQRYVEMHQDLPSIKKRVFELAEPGDVVLLKGSLTNQLWLVLE